MFGNTMELHQNEYAAVEMTFISGYKVEARKLVHNCRHQPRKVLYAGMDRELAYKAWRRGVRLVNRLDLDR